MAVTTAHHQADWQRTLPPGPRKVLDVLLQWYPAGLSQEELAEQAELTSSDEPLGSCVDKLRRRAIVVLRDGRLTAADGLFPAA